MSEWGDYLSFLSLPNSTIAIMTNIKGSAHVLIIAHELFFCQER